MTGVECTKNGKSRCIRKRDKGGKRNPRGARGRLAPQNLQLARHDTIFQASKCSIQNADALQYGINAMNVIEPKKGRSQTGAKHWHRREGGSPKILYLAWLVRVVRHPSNSYTINRSIQHQSIRNICSRTLSRLLPTSAPRQSYSSWTGQSGASSETGHDDCAFSDSSRSLWQSLLSSAAGLTLELLQLAVQLVPARTYLS